MNNLELNINKWGKFKIKDLFLIVGSKTTLIDDLEEYGYGKFPYITTQSTDNGIVNYYNFYTENGNVLVIDSAVTGFCSYQETNFSASDHVEKLIPRFENFNKYIGLFISTIINQENYRYFYGRKFNQKRIRETVIELPIDNQGNPDWQFMEHYIKNIYEPIHKKIGTKINNKKIELNVGKWKKFKVSDLFDCELSKGDIKEGECENGNVPLISSGTLNNGVIQFIDKEGDGIAEIFKGNCLTVDMFCQAFYQEQDFYAVSHGRINILIPKFTLNKYIALFICTLINNEKYRFFYGKAVYSYVIKNLYINLPVNNQGNPDWQFMENYIKQLPYSDVI